MRSNKSTNAGHRALRRGRSSLPGGIYLLTIVTTNRKKFFLDTELASTIARMHLDQNLLLDAKLLCWVLMPDHWHGLVQLGQRPLSRIVARFKSATARVLNQRMGVSGAVWQRAFHDHALRSDEDILVVARYVIANPIRAGLVRGVGAYPFWDAIWS
jgi:putative transposase